MAALPIPPKATLEEHVKTQAEFLEKNGDKGWKSLEDFRGLRRDRVVPQSQIRRPNPGEYHGGHEAEGYAAPEPAPVPAGSREK